MNTIIKPDSQGQRRTFYQLHCKHCGKEVWRIKQHIGSEVFCSIVCKKQATNHKVSCAICTKEFWIKPSRFEACKSKIFFCSIDCHTKGQFASSGLKAIQVKNAGEGESYYRTLAFELYPPKCNRCGYSKFPEILEVHHKDCDRENSAPDNLEILCSNCHAEEHWINKTGKFAPKKSGGTGRLRSDYSTMPLLCDTDFTTAPKFRAYRSPRGYL